MSFLMFIESKRIVKEFYDSYGDYKVYLVDEELVRNSSLRMEEFGGYGTHLDFSKIPVNEIWVNKLVSSTEKFFYINNALMMLKRYSLGDSKKEAYEYALRHERKLREIIDKIAIHPERFNEKPPSYIYKDNYGKMYDGVYVKVIKGEIVRDKYKTDYIEGGHGYVYRWIPLNEIWLEDSVLDEEKPYILLHEYVERYLMKEEKYNYNDAHKIASKVEYQSRSKSLSKKEILGLNFSDVKELVKDVDID